MTRSVTKLVVGAAVAVLAAVPGIAAAQGTTGVDERTGPVAFANVASVKVGEEGTGGGTVITETQRSPLKAGISKLSSDRAGVPKDDGEKKALGSNYLIQLGKFGTVSPFPAGVGSRDHNVIATLAASTAPSASAETHYALQDNGRGKPDSLGNTVLAFQNARTAVDCSTPDRLVGSSTADKLWVRDAADALTEVKLPEGEAKAVVPGVRFGAPGDIQNVDRARTTSDVTISRLTTFDRLLRQEAWRGGDVTAVAGWRIDVLSHVVKTDKSILDVKTRIVLGGVSCSVPKGFVARVVNNVGVAQAQQPAVPLKIPSGGAPAERSSRPIGLALLGVGVLLGAGAVWVVRRRRTG